MDSVTDTLNRWRNALLDRLPYGGLGKGLALVLGLYLLITLLLGVYWSIVPGSFDVEERAREIAAEEGGRVVTGSVTTGALIAVMDTLLNKRGG